MDEVRNLKDELGRIRQLMDAGRRGPPIGGELLAAFGAILGITALSQGASAFSLVPLELSVSPLAAAAAFLAAVLATPLLRARGAPAYMLLCLAAGLAGEVAWRGTLGWMQSQGEGLGQAGSSLPLVLFGAVIGCLALAAIFALVGLFHRSEALSSVNRTLIGVWSSVAAAMVVLVAISVLSGVRSGLWFAFMMLPSLFWMLWGLGWAISGWVSHSRWMHLVALGSWLLAAWQALGLGFYWTSAVGLFAFALAPGLRLIHEARRSRGEA